MPPVTTRIRARDDPRGRNLSLIMRAPRPHNPPRGHEPLHAVRRGHIIGDLASAAVFVEALGEIIDAQGLQLAPKLLDGLSREREIVKPRQWAGHSVNIITIAIPAGPVGLRRRDCEAAAEEVEGEEEGASEATAGN